MGEVVTIAGGIVGALILALKYFAAQQQKLTEEKDRLRDEAQKRTEDALKESNRRHDLCEQQHAETRATLVKVNGELKLLEGSVKGYKEAKEEIRTLSEGVLELLEEIKSTAKETDG